MHDATPGLNDCTVLFYDRETYLGWLIQLQRGVTREQRDMQHAYMSHIVHCNMFDSSLVSKFLRGSLPFFRLLRCTPYVVERGTTAPAWLS